MKKPNRFTSIIEAAHEGPEVAGGGLVETPEIPDLPTMSHPPALPQGPPPKGAGRPKGKRSHPDFEQVSAYIPSVLYSRVRIALIEDGRRQEFSDVVADLLSGWLEKRKAE